MRGLGGGGEQVELLVEGRVVGGDGQLGPAFLGPVDKQITVSRPPATPLLPLPPRGPSPPVLHPAPPPSLPPRMAALRPWRTGYRVALRAVPGELAG